MKRTILMLTVVSLLVVGIAFAKPPGALGPPELLSITPGDAEIDGEVVPVFLLDWTDVPGADKYSVDVTALAICDTGDVDPDTLLPILVEIEVQASFGTSDRLDGGDMADSDLNIPVSDVEDLAAELDLILEGLLLAEVIESVDSIEITAKVKALDPSVKPTKRQNNPFSNSLPIVLP